MKKGWRLAPFAADELGELLLLVALRAEAATSEQD
jgi:hypothetical protein